MDRSEESRDRKRAGFSLSQETITILTVGVALAGIIVATYGDMRIRGPSRARGNAFSRPGLTARGSKRR